jgi:hypothetical protein
MIMKLENRRPGPKGAVEPVKKQYSEQNTVSFLFRFTVIQKQILRIVTTFPFVAGMFPPT